MMLNFDTELDRKGVTRMVTPVAEVEGSAKTIGVADKVRKPEGSRDTSHKMVPESQWGWREIRDYVVSEIEARTGIFPRISYKEEAIFKRFFKDWGDRAAPIAKFAFEIENGKWGGAPIAIGRFSKNSDPYFAEPISQRLASDDITKNW